MLARLPRLTLVRLWIALLLGAIGLHALLVLPPSLEARPGSAFAPVNEDVALVVKRIERTQRQLVTPPPLPLPPLRPSSPQLTTPSVRHLPMPRPVSTGPPPAETRTWDTAPRAPPRA